MGLFTSNDTKHTTTGHTRRSSNDHKNKKPDHVSSHTPREGGHTTHPTLGQKLTGAKLVLEGKLQHDPAKVVKGEMMKGNDVHISSSASNPNRLGGPRH